MDLKNKINEAIENDDLDLTCTYIKDINKIYLKIKS